MKVRDATLAELVPARRADAELGPSQQRIRKRELVIGRALQELSAGPRSLVKRVELEEAEKLMTIRAAIVRQLKAEHSEVKVSLRNGAIFLHVGPIPR